MMFLLFFPLILGILVLSYFNKEAYVSFLLIYFLF
jgi:hypothetical protein